MISAARRAARPLLSAGMCSARTTVLGGRGCPSSTGLSAAICSGAVSLVRAALPPVESRSRQLQILLRERPVATFHEARSGGSCGGGVLPGYSTGPKSGGWAGGVPGDKDERGCDEISFNSKRQKPRRIRPKMIPSQRSRGGNGGGRLSPAGENRPSGRSNISKMFTATNALLTLNVGIFILQTQDPSITANFCNLGGAIIGLGEWYRLGTAMALHGSLEHLLVNNLSLFSVGRPMESQLGTTKFVALYLCSGVAGALVSCVAHPFTPSVGASGAIFGVRGAETTRLLTGPYPSFLLFFWSLAETPLSCRLYASCS